MQQVDIVAVGASAGGLDPLVRLIRSLPKDAEAAFFIATHRTLPHTLVEIFDGQCPVPVETAQAGIKIRQGRVYVCPADHNLWLEHGRMRVERSPKETYYRPSINALFRSAASIYGRHVAGVLLSGLMEDGVAGLWHIKERGGTTIVQDPREADYPSMPQSAIDNVRVDYVLPVEAIAEKLALLSKRPAGESGSRAKVLIVEDEYFLADDMGQWLQQRGYHVAGKFGSGEDALYAIAKERPDIVLMDIRLAGTLSGTEAARIIWDRFQIPVVYLTAYGDLATLDEVKACGGYGFVLKPFRIEAVQGAIELALDRREREMAIGFGG